MQRTAIAAIRRPGDELDCNRLVLRFDGTFLKIRLPSGRSISYPFAREGQGKYGDAVVIFKDAQQGQFKDCKHGAGFWGGALVENVVQAIARDILTDAIVRLEEADYPVVLTIHDEIIVERPAGVGSIEEFKALIEQRPVWAPELPIAVKARVGPRLANIDLPVTTWIPGSLDTVPQYVAQHKGKTPKPKRVSTAKLSVPRPLDPEAIARVVAFAIEREGIRKRKEAGQQPPWTDDAILRIGHFCNLHRENDRTTQWVNANIVTPQRNDPDLWHKLVIARCCSNQPDALAEFDWSLPFDAVAYRSKVEALLAGGKKVYRTDAYKPVMPPRELAGISLAEYHGEYFLPALWRDREELRPRVDNTLASFADRLCEYPRFGGFYAGQVIADLKQIGPLSDASDWWTWAASGPGSLRGLNRICRRPIKTTWSEPVWHATLLQLGTEIAPQLAAADIAPLDAQNLQNVLCEFDKYARADEKGGKPSRKYKPTAAPLPRPESEPPKSAEIAIAGRPQPTPSPPAAPEPDEIPAYILEDAPAATAARPKASRKASPQPESEPSKSEAAAGPQPESEARVPLGNGSGRSDSRHAYPHGERDTGAPIAFHTYRDARGCNYLGIQRTSTKQFPQYHWTGQQWCKGLPKGFLKIPYRLPELLDAPPDAWVVIAAGEKDAETAAALGFVATTNSGGEGKGQWTPELGRWFAGKQRVAVMEDNDVTGHAHALEVATALRGIVPDIRIVGFRELKTHGDLTDWINAVPGRGHAELLARIEAAAPAEPELDEWDAGELLAGALPEPRQWLTAGQFCRTFLSGLVAPGDVGKTTLRLTQAIELATGRELVGLRVFQRCRVLVLSFEDDRAELHRRLLAICKHHGIDPGELKGWLFCRDLNSGPKLAELDSKGRRRQVGALEGMLRRAIARTGCDLLILDPFVKLHGLNESDNPDMDFVCSLLIKIAQDCNIAVDSPAHTHKGAITAGDADARRGASAQRDAGRLDYTFTVMSEDEAKQFGIAADMRKSYMRLDKAKANIVRAVKARWFRLASVRLDNATALYPDGDEVQAIERWEPPETWAGVDGETLNAILDAIDAGLPDGRRYIDHGAAKDRAAWLAVQKHCPDKPEVQCREMIKQWVKAEVLFRDKYPNPLRREEEKGLFVDADKRPPY